MPLPAFKAYDIRGRVPDELNAGLASRIGVALSAQLGPGPVVVGHDVRLTSPELQDALALGLRSAGREVIDIGLCGTEEVYFQVDHLGAAGGVMVTASHNPMDYNGMKLVREQARPISSDTGLFAISTRWPPAPPRPAPNRRAEPAPGQGPATSSTCWATCGTPAQAAETGGQRRQWRCRCDRGPAGPTPALRVRAHLP
jgi:Phosphomannomutase